MLNSLRDYDLPLRATEIAARLSQSGRGVSATEVNRALYGAELRSMVVQDRDFRWYVREPYRRMEEHLAALLSRSPVPLTAKELSRQLADLFGEAIDTSVINGFLYGDRMRGLAVKDDEHRWRPLGPEGVRRPGQQIYFG